MRIKLRGIGKLVSVRIELFPLYIRLVHKEYTWSYYRGHVQKSILK